MPPLWSPSTIAAKGRAAETLLFAAKDGRYCPPTEMLTAAQAAVLTATEARVAGKEIATAPATTAGGCAMFPHSLAATVAHVAATEATRAYAGTATGATTTATSASHAATTATTTTGLSATVPYLGSMESCLNFWAANHAATNTAAAGGVAAPVAHNFWAATPPPMAAVIAAATTAHSPLVQHSSCSYAAEPDTATAAAQQELKPMKARLNGPQRVILENYWQSGDARTAVAACGLAKQIDGLHGGRSVNGKVVEFWFQNQRSKQTRKDRDAKLLHDVMAATAAKTATVPTEAERQIETETETETQAQTGAVVAFSVAVQQQQQARAQAQAQTAAAVAAVLAEQAQAPTQVHVPTQAHAHTHTHTLSQAQAPTLASTQSPMQTQMQTLTQMQTQTQTPTHTPLIQTQTLTQTQTKTQTHTQMQTQTQTQTLAPTHTPQTHTPKTTAGSDGLSQTCATTAASPSEPTSTATQTSTPTLAPTPATATPTAAPTGIAETVVDHTQFAMQQKIVHLMHADAQATTRIESIEQTHTEISADDHGGAKEETKSTLAHPHALDAPHHQSTPASGVSQELPPEMCKQNGAREDVLEEKMKSADSTEHGAVAAAHCTTPAATNALTFHVDAARTPKKDFGAIIHETQGLLERIIADTRAATTAATAATTADHSTSTGGPAAPPVDSAELCESELSLSQLLQCPVLQHARSAATADTTSVPAASKALEPLSSRSTAAGGAATTQAQLTTQAGSIYETPKTENPEEDDDDDMTDAEAERLVRMHLLSGSRVVDSACHTA